MQLRPVVALEVPVDPTQTAIRAERLQAYRIKDGGFHRNPSKYSPSALNFIFKLSVAVANHLGLLKLLVKHSQF